MYPAICENSNNDNNNHFTLKDSLIYIKKFVAFIESKKAIL